MCGPMASAAAETADASGAFAVTTKMLPPDPHPRVSNRARSFAMEEMGVLEERDVPRRLPHPGQQNGRVAELLLRVGMDVQHVVPERKPLLRRRPGLQIEDLLQRVVVERREPRAHLLFVAPPVIDERGRGRVVGGRELLLPHVFGLPLQSCAPARLHVERVHERPSQIARRHARGHLELGARELGRALEHAVLRPVAEVEERLEILPAHGFERSAAMRRRTVVQSAGVLAGANVRVDSLGERRASAAIEIRSRSSSSCTSSPRFIASTYARSSASPSSGSPSSARRAARPRRPESFDTTMRRACQPTDCGVMISYVPGSLSTPSWWMPEACANAFAPTTALFGCTGIPVSSLTSRLVVTSRSAFTAVSAR